MGDETTDDRKHVVVIGGGISGLAAARALVRSDRARAPRARGVDTRVTVIESSRRLGGKIHTTPFAGALVDTGADAMLTRLPWAAHLCNEVGIGDELVAPATSTSYFYSRERFHRFPKRAVMGIPGNAFDLLTNDVVSPLGRLRALAELVLPAHVGRRDADPSIGSFFRARFGNEFTERVVDSLVGGIHAGDIDRLSLDSCLGQIADIGARRSSVVLGVGEHLARRSAEDSDKPVFQTHPDGMSAVVDALTDDLVERGVEIVLDHEVEQLTVEGDRSWDIVTGTDHQHADGIVLATPAHVSARLLSRTNPDAAALLRSIEYSSVGIVRLSYPLSAIGRDLDGSGYVVPSVDAGLVTACTWSSSKWAHLRQEDHVILRASVGRTTDTRFTSMDDPELIEAVHLDVARALAISARPAAADVTRWTKALPQYEPDHEGRVLLIEKAIATLPAITLAGAAYHGVGITACVRGSHDAAEHLLAALGNTSSSHGATRPSRR